MTAESPEQPGPGSTASRLGEAAKQVRIAKGQADDQRVRGLLGAVETTLEEVVDLVADEHRLANAEPARQPPDAGSVDGGDHQ